MKKVVFVGGMDKLDLITYLAFLVQESKIVENSKCLIADFTKMQKSRYLIPTIELPENRPEKYITTYQKTDVAVGYMTYNELIEGGVITAEEKEYGYILINVDSKDVLNTIPIAEGDKVFLTTTFDIYSLEKAVEAFEDFNNNIQVDMILFNNKIEQSHYTYINYLFGKNNIKWGSYVGEFPFDNGDLTVIYENQRAGRMNVRNFSKKFKSELIELTSYIAETSKSKPSKLMDILMKN